jgi:hypothetical protein
MVKALSAPAGGLAENRNGGERLITSKLAQLIVADRTIGRPSVVQLLAHRAKTSSIWQ